MGTNTIRNRRRFFMSVSNGEITIANRRIDYPFVVIDLRDITAILYDIKYLTICSKNNECLIIPDAFNATDNRQSIPLSAKRQNKEFAEKLNDVLKQSPVYEGLYIGREAIRKRTSTKTAELKKEAIGANPFGTICSKCGSTSLITSNNDTVRNTVLYGYLARLLESDGVTIVCTNCGNKWTSMVK